MSAITIKLCLEIISYCNHKECLNLNKTKRKIVNYIHKIFFSQLNILFYINGKKKHDLHDFSRPRNHNSLICPYIL